MNTPAPKLAVNDLIDQIDALFQPDSNKPDSVTLDRLEWQAKKCIRSHPHGGYMVLGLLAARRWDEAAMENAFQAALAHGWTTAWALNYGDALLWLYRGPEALAQVRTVINQGPGPHYTRALAKAVRWAHLLGRFHLASDLIATLRQQSEPLPDNVEDLAKTLPSLVQAADALELADDVIAAIVAPIWQLARERKLEGAIGVRDDVYHDDSLFLGRTFLLPVSSDEVLPLYEALVEAETTREEPLPIWKFSVGLEAMEAA